MRGYQKCTSKRGEGGDVFIYGAGSIAVRLLPRTPVCIKCRSLLLVIFPPSSKLRALYVVPRGE